MPCWKKWGNRFLASQHSLKLLLDECMDRRLAREFVGYAIQTVPQMGWAGTADSQLLALAASEFDVFLTVDRHLPFQQNLPQFNVAVVVLQAPSNRLADLKPLVPKVIAALDSVVKGQATVIRA